MKRYLHVTGDRATPNPNHLRDGTLVTINFLMSPEAQYQKALPDVWGIGTGLDLSTLPPTWREEFHSLPTPQSGVDPMTAAKHQVPVLHAEYIRLMESEWRNNVLLEK